MTSVPLNSTQAEDVIRATSGLGSQPSSTGFLYTVKTMREDSEVTGLLVSMDVEFFYLNEVNLDEPRQRTIWWDDVQWIKIAGFD